MESASISSSPTVPIYKNQIKDDINTDTTLDQEETEDAVLKLLLGAKENPETKNLLKEKHLAYAKKMLGPLPAGFVSLDASRPWCVYWGTNAMMLLGDKSVQEVYGKRIASTILACVSPEGGIGGGHGQIGHLAASYASINSLAISGDEEAWNKLDRKAIYDWLLRIKQPDGSFKMHIGGECDTRSAYCALAIASLLNIITPELVENTAEYLSRCQTYEGGFSGVPGLEAHGGYAFCALASFCILFPPKEVHKHINIDKLIRWLSRRQHQPEGGFSGRTNKLVDGCYNHWVGGCWALIENIVSYHDLWDRTALQNYTLYCCQSTSGGLRDKPGKNPDAYHTNYTLAGLSGAQYRYIYEGGEDDQLGDYAFRWRAETTDRIVVSEGNYVAKINPIHVLREGIAETMHKFFEGRPL
ncbi:hypothetical protein DV451_003696 [Geotrichum candidum]|uniref:Protein farnesyltransferase subunit beta n=1 Tax=Geotrichum candidum TaxID=1173061 RepID=A0A9P5G3H6_GEOCN|nr:hypothetical protein DV451_003696 [Geotrichum candidum]KAF5107515.1 hypothetical protein DV453_003045 [Geotrichum candidum]